MKKSIIMVLSIFCLLMIICCSSKHYILPNENLNRFKYVYVLLPQDDPHQLGMKLQNLFKQKGLMVINNSEFNALTQDEKGAAIVCGLTFRKVILEASLTLDCYDIFNRNIYKGEGSTIFDDIPDFGGMLERSFKGFSVNYRKFDPSIAKKPKDEATKVFPNYRSLEYTEDQLIEYYKANYSNLDPLEGIWTSDDRLYKIGIIRDKDSVRNLSALIISSNHPFWVEKQVKIEFEKTAYDNIYSTTYYMSDHTKQGTTSVIEKEGLLKIPLKDEKGNSIDGLFIKNYPSEGINRGLQESASSQITGSGFLFHESGLVATNYHVVIDKKDITIFFPDIQAKYTASILLKDKVNDLAVLKITNFNLLDIKQKTIPYSIRSTKFVNIGQNVFTLGYPLGEVLGSSIKLSDGKITSLNGIQDDPRLFQISNPIQPGNSGGPLFNYKGEIVGIIVASLNAKYFYEKADIIPQNVNFAIKIDYLINLIEMLPEGDKILKNKPVSVSDKIENQIKVFQPFMVSIMAK